MYYHQRLQRVCLCASWISHINHPTILCLQLVLLGSTAASLTHVSIHSLTTYVAANPLRKHKVLILGTTASHVIFTSPATCSAVD